MRVKLSLAVLAVSMICANLSFAQSPSLHIVYGPCTITNIVNDFDAQYAAAVGVMSTDKAVRARLLGPAPGRRGAGRCTFQVSDAFCSSEFLGVSVEMLTTSMTAGGAGRHLYRALGVAEAVDDPAGNAIDLTLGVGGAILGGIRGSRDGLGGIAKGGTIGGAAGVGLGAFLKSSTAYKRCNQVQADFTALTDKLVAAGLTHHTHHRHLFGEIRRLTARSSVAERETAEAMIEAMAIAAKKIASIR